MVKRIGARELQARLAGPEEIALIDVREQAPYAASHPILAANIPLDGLALLVGAHIPRRPTPTVVEDGGEGLAEPAAAASERFGYTDVEIGRAAGRVRECPYG